MTADQLAVVRGALTGGHAGNLSAEGQRRYLDALGILDRAAGSLRLQRANDFICGAMWRQANPDASRQQMKDAAQYWAASPLESADAGVKGPDHG